MSETTPAAAPAEPPSLADRLGQACVELRSDLQTSRHVFRGEVWYVLLDPLSFSSHRFSQEDYAILTRLTAKRPLEEVFAELLAADELSEDDSDRFYGFVFSLHKIGFLHLPISDEKSLYNRHMAKRTAQRSQALKSALFFRIPILQPDALLTRTARFARPFFSRLAFAVWLGAVALAGWVVVRNWTEFTEPVGDIFRNENLPLLWISLIGLKVMHEFGHAYATKLLGGHVPEMGLFMMIFTPCAYVDSTAAWGFSRKRDRLIVNFAGMYVELFLAACAVMLWSIMPPGLWRSVMHNVAMLASVVTIGFNINPLMRYDGYYALSDALEIPNLRARAQAEGVRLLKRLVLGVRIDGEQRAGLRAFLVFFGAASAIYKVVLVLGISATIALKFPAVGLAMGAAYVLSEVWGILKRSIPYLWGSQETSSVRAWAVSLMLMIVAGLPLAIAAIPVPASVTTVGVLSSQTDIVLRAEASGFLQASRLTPGCRVEKGELLVQLRDEEVCSKLADVEARLDVAKLRAARARGADPATREQEDERVRQLSHERDERAAELSELSVKSPLRGRVVEGFDERELGRYVTRGEPIASLVAGHTVVRALLSEEELVAIQAEPGTAVEFRSKGTPGKTWQGTLTHIVPAGRRQFDQAFAVHLDAADYAVNPMTGKAGRSLFELEVSIDDDSNRSALPHGMTGRLRFRGDSEPLGLTLLRKTLTFVRRLSS